MATTENPAVAAPALGDDDPAAEVAAALARQGPLVVEGAEKGAAGAARGRGELWFGA